ncbi:MAG TPA: electron transfer flavoprotein subunit beta/FixA family protein, partial [Roseiflexaceae bacterium]
SSTIELTADGQDIDTRYLGFTISPHEECAVEEAVRLTTTHGGAATALTLGPAAAEEQLRDALAMGVDRAVLLETDRRDWDPAATAAAIVAAIRARSTPFDLLLFGNEAADSGDYQVGIRVAHALDLPCVTGVKALEIAGGRATARREVPGGWEVFDVALPAVVTVREGINLPRYVPLLGRLKAKKKPIERVRPAAPANALEMARLTLPAEQRRQVSILGTGPEAAPAAVEVLRALRLVER